MKYEDKTVDGHQKNVPALASRRKYNIRPGRNSSADSSKSASSVPRLKKILFWNKVSDNIKVRTRYKNYGLGSGQRIFLEFGCPFNACTVTGSRKRFAFKDLDAIVWNQRSKDRSFPPISTYEVCFYAYGTSWPCQKKNQATHKYIQLDTDLSLGLRYSNEVGHTQGLDD
ncbi:hypothetical protein SK128_015041 [Halocaridina rubra]|uniref:Uncharacterized protein n=1 Tax=Halocaridina rubra TaxID=373956 RepID=A0AAN8XFL9_HALRR